MGMNHNERSHAAWDVEVMADVAMAMAKGLGGYVQAAPCGVQAVDDAMARAHAALALALVQARVAMDAAMEAAMALASVKLPPSTEDERNSDTDVDNTTFRIERMRQGR